MSIVDSMLEIIKDAGISRWAANAGFICFIIWWISRNHFFSSLVRRHFYKKEMERQSEVDINVIDHMNVYKEAIKCSRLSVYEFHNSKHNLNGKSFLKMSCSYEVCEVGKCSYNIYQKDNPMSLYREILQMISTKKPINVSLETASAEIHNELKNRYSSSVIFIPIILHEAVLGFLCIEFSDKEKIDDTEFNEICFTGDLLLKRIGHMICSGHF